jgi:hypothetical protein
MFEDSIPFSIIVTVRHTSFAVSTMFTSQQRHGSFFIFGAAVTLKLSHGIVDHDC